MVTKKPSTTNDSAELQVRFPSVLTLRDFLTILVAVITLTLAWGVFSTRLTVIEKELFIVSQQLSEAKADIKTLNSHVNNLELRTSNNEILIDDLYVRSKLPVPKHSVYVEPARAVQ